MIATKMSQWQGVALLGSLPPPTPLGAPPGGSTGVFPRKRLTSFRRRATIWPLQQRTESTRIPVSGRAIGRAVNWRGKINAWLGGLADEATTITGLSWSSHVPTAGVAAKADRHSDSVDLRLLDECSARNHH